MFQTGLEKETVLILKNLWKMQLLKINSKEKLLLSRPKPEQAVPTTNTTPCHGGGGVHPCVLLGSAPVLIERASCHLKTGLLWGEDTYMSEFQMLKTNLIKQFVVTNCSKEQPGSIVTKTKKKQNFYINSYIKRIKF